MACKCCERYAPKHLDGSALPPCAGTAAIEEARNLARLWHGRAIAAGYKSETQKAEEKSREKHTGEKPRRPHLGIDVDQQKLIAQSKMTTKERTADHLAESLADGKTVAYCQGPERHHYVVGGRGYEAFVERGCFHCGAFPGVAP